MKSISTAVMAYLASRGGDTPGVVEHGVEVEGALAQRRVLVSSQLILHGLQSHRSADVVIVVWDAVVRDLYEVTRDVSSVDILVRLNGVEDILSTTAQICVCSGLGYAAQVHNSKERRKGVECRTCSLRSNLNSSRCPYIFHSSAFDTLFK